MTIHTNELLLQLKLLLKLSLVVHWTDPVPLDGLRRWLPLDGWLLPQGTDCGVVWLEAEGRVGGDGRGKRLTKLHPMYLDNDNISLNALVYYRTCCVCC